MGDVVLIAQDLTLEESKAMRGFFFSEAVGETLLAKGLFASRDGWPMTELGGQVQRLLFDVALASMPGEGSKP